MQVINFHDDAAVAWSVKWQICLLSRTSLTLAPGHQALLIFKPCIIFVLLYSQSWRACMQIHIHNISQHFVQVWLTQHLCELWYRCRLRKACLCFKEAFRRAADVFMQMLLSQVCVWLRRTERQEWWMLLDFRPGAFNAYTLSKPLCVWIIFVTLSSLPSRHFHCIFACCCCLTLSWSSWFSSAYL